MNDDHIRIPFSCTHCSLASIFTISVPGTPTKHHNTIITYKKTMSLWKIFRSLLCASDIIKYSHFFWVMAGYSYGTWNGIGMESLVIIWTKNCDIIINKKNPHGYKIFKIQNVPMDCLVWLKNRQVHTMGVYIYRIDSTVLLETK